jgi:hypothetical protein
MTRRKTRRRRRRRRTSRRLRRKRRRRKKRNNKNKKKKTMKKKRERGYVPQMLTLTFLPHLTKQGLVIFNSSTKIQIFDFPFEDFMQAPTIHIPTHIHIRHS